MQRLIITTVMCFISVFTMNAQVSTKITIRANSFVATLYDNETAKAFADLLPLTITMNELNGNEKYHYLSSNLPASPENPSIIHNGDLMLYGSNCILLFYETFNTTYSYTKIGTVDNPTELEAALGSNNPTVKFELDGNTTGMGSTQTNNNALIISNDGFLQYTGDAQRISLFDINGRLLISTTAQVISLNNFSRGIYLLKIESQWQKQTHTIKFKY